MVLVPRHGNRPWLKFRKNGCPSETLNSSLWHHRVGDWNRFAARYGKTMEYLKGVTESTTPDTVLWWLVSGQPQAQSLPLSFQGLAHVPLSHPSPCPRPWLSASLIFLASTPDRQHGGLAHYQVTPSSQTLISLLLFSGHELNNWAWQNVGKAVQGDSQALSEPFPSLLWGSGLSHNIPVHRSLWVGTGRGQGVGRSGLPSEGWQFLLSFPE